MQILIMADNIKTIYDDQIDIRKSLLTIWHGKVYILLFAILFIFLGSYHLRNAERVYLVQYDLKPVGESQQKNTFSGLSGFASLAGIELPQSSNNDFKIFKKLITSTEVSEIIFENKKIIKDVFRSEWNETLNNYSQPPRSKKQVFISDIKKLLTGDKEVSYMPPNSKRLATFIKNNIQINEDKETGFLRFESETSNPELMLSIIIEAANAGDKIMRQRYVDFSTEPLVFYKEKLRTARSREHREALAGLIGREEQRLMFASQGKYFIAEPYIKPTISLNPIAPKPKSILLLSLVLGLFLGVALVLMRHAIKKEINE